MRRREGEMRRGRRGRRDEEEEGGMRRGRRGRRD